MADHVLPRKRRPKLIVVVAFDRGERSAELFPAYGPELDQQSEERAIRTARGDGVKPCRRNSMKHAMHDPALAHDRRLCFSLAATWPEQPESGHRQAWRWPLSTASIPPDILQRGVAQLVLASQMPDATDQAQLASLSDMTNYGLIRAPAHER